MSGKAHCQLFLIKLVPNWEETWSGSKREDIGRGKGKGQREGDKGRGGQEAQKFWNAGEKNKIKKLDNKN